MKKGTITTCNGCLAYEERNRSGAGGWMANTSESYCSIGIKIEKHPTKYGYRPETGTCPKPKTISEEVKEKRKFFKKYEIQ